MLKDRLFDLKRFRNQMVKVKHNYPITVDYIQLHTKVNSYYVNT